MAISGLAQRLAAGAVMVLTIATGVGVALSLPRAGGGPALELARPAPVARTPLPAWLAPSPPPPPAEAARDAQAAAPAKPPPLRTRRLETAQATARPHAQHAPPIVRAAACDAARSAADRLVCARPALAAQEREMRRAYDRALAAGADRLAIDRAQARFRGERDRTSNAADLSHLYARRIAELDDAARQVKRRS